MSDQSLTLIKGTLVPIFIFKTQSLQNDQDSCILPHGKKYFLDLVVLWLKLEVFRSLFHLDK